MVFKFRSFLQLFTGKAARGNSVLPVLAYGLINNATVCVGHSDVRLLLCRTSKHVNISKRIRLLRVAAGLG